MGTYRDERRTLYQVTLEQVQMQTCVTHVGEYNNGGLHSSNPEGLYLHQYHTSTYTIPIPHLYHTIPTPYFTPYVYSTIPIPIERFAHLYTHLPPLPHTHTHTRTHTHTHTPLSSLPAKGGKSTSYSKNTAAYQGGAYWTSAPKNVAGEP